MNDVSRFIKAIELIRKSVHRELPVQQLVLFLAVIEKPGITMPELVERCDMPQGTVSRNVKALSHYVVWKGGVAVPQGRNLLHTQTDTANHHVLAVYPTGRGEALAQEMVQCLYSDEEQPSVVRRADSGNEEIYRHWPRREARRYEGR
ncbi:MAG: MarR family transcriptional regulator [Deltaproteobacteria bacterium]|nr:MarR family transcriptional regulator [Deltaproteobacteria bacterium]NCP03867.1 MarR family transcriptional regulator [Deltaproteobacteria bacterium]